MCGSFYSQRMRSRISAVALALLALTVAFVQSAPAGKRLSGVVLTTGSDEAPVYLPGVTINLRKKGQQTVLFSTVSDDLGRFNFEQVPAGDYLLEAELTGFTTASRILTVTKAGIDNLRVDMQVAGTSENLTVQADTDGIDTQQTSSSEQLAQGKLDSLPLANERMLDALPLLPGVIRGPDGLLSLNGARPNQSSELINGTNVTDPATGNFSFNLPIEAVDSVKVISSPYSAEYGKFLGAVTAIETRPGADHWKWLFTNFLPRPRKRSGSIVGIESFTPRLVFSGPLVKDKISLAQTFEYRYLRTRVPSLPDLENDTTLESFDSFTQVDIDFSAEHRLSSVFTLYPEKLGFVGLNTFNPRQVTPDFKRRGFFLGFNDRLILGNQSLLESRVSFQKFDADVLSNGQQDMTLAPDRNSGSYFNQQNRASHRFQSSEIFSFPTLFARGEHQIRIGSYVSRDVLGGHSLNRPVRVVRSDGTLSQLLRFDGAGQLDAAKTELAFFVQDKWNPFSRLTLDLGLRYGFNGLTSENIFAPRLGFAAALSGDNRTLLRGGFGIFFADVPLNVGVFTQQQDRLVSTFDLQGNPLGAPRLFQHLTSDAGLKTPYSIDWNLQLDRQVAQNLFLRIGLQRRESRREFVVEPGTSVGRPALLLSSTGRSLYREFEVTTRYRLSDGRQVVFSYVRSSAVGDLNDLNSYYGNFQNPILRANERAPLPFDAPHRFLSWADFGIPWGLTLSPVVDMRSGFPYSALNENLEFVGARNRAGRFPAFVSFDLKVTKRLVIPFGDSKYGVRVGVKIFNLTNHFNPRDVQDNLASAEFGQFFNSVGRTFRGKLEFDF